MYNYHADQTNKTQISLVQGLMAMSIVLATFVIPVQLISLKHATPEISPYSINAPQTNSPRVAGASTLDKNTDTTSPFSLSNLGAQIGLPEKFEPLLLIGGGLLVAGLTLFLYILNNNPGKYYYEEDPPFSLR